ncbi:hypothetical protein GUA46_13710 [Muricauda sp. HICW]|uniref:Uncharacterized protein n=1 Tax=Flagellimonas chongwuensis TaxID=2697365 RepID=A0A850NE29_9FLAO|nr:MULTISPECIES: hypothetical protein [Allomuricauda]NVN19401.1 hypothetical protein [Allomuricauda chongwuensis]
MDRIPLYFAVDGTEVYVTQAPVGERETCILLTTILGKVTQGDLLVNLEGSDFIGTCQDNP